MSEYIVTYYRTYEPADETIVAERQSICLQCDDFDNETTACGICHCEQQHKWALIESKCPLGKWT